MKFFNKKIATEVPTSTSIKTRVESGVAMIEQRRQLTPLKVLFNSGDWLVGDVIYVKGDTARVVVSEKYVQDGVEFVLVPEEMVVAAVQVPRPQNFFPGGGGFTTTGDILCVAGTTGTGEAK